MLTVITAREVVRCQFSSKQVCPFRYDKVLFMMRITRQLPSSSETKFLKSC